MDDQIKIIIVKFLSREADINELRQLELWIGNPENEPIFREFIEANAIMTMSLGKYDKDKAKAIILKQIRKEKTLWGNWIKPSFPKYVAAALVGMLLLGLGYLAKDGEIDNPTINPTIVDASSIQPGTDKATLLLEDGSVIDLGDEKDYQSAYIKNNGKEIIYAPQKNAKEVKYNYLTIPRGGQYFLKLADDTEVWLNSETQLKYPVNFIPDRPREVELVYGEAYFNVSPSTKHNRAKFTVLHQSQKIEVLGTQFNLKAYHDEQTIYSTLVEGSVLITHGDSTDKLSPGQQSKLDIENDVISIDEVDIESEISWKDGIFIFKGKPLKEIMKVISRWYDADVLFEDKALESVKFRGVLSKQQEVEQILSIMKSTSIKDYEIRDKTIILR